MEIWMHRYDSWMFRVMAAKLTEEEFRTQKPCRKPCCRNIIAGQQVHAHSWKNRSDNGITFASLP
jgi:hypothetical protein